MYDIIELNNKLVGELKDIAKNLNIPKYDALKKQELVYKILDHQAINPIADKITVETTNTTNIAAVEDTVAAKAVIIKNNTPIKNSNNNNKENITLRPRKVRLENIDTESKTKEKEVTPFFHEEDFSVNEQKEEVDFKAENAISEEAVDPTITPVVQSFTNQEAENIPENIPEHTIDNASLDRKENQNRNRYNQRQQEQYNWCRFFRRYRFYNVNLHYTSCVRQCRHRKQFKNCNSNCFTYCRDNWFYISQTNT